MRRIFLGLAYSSCVLCACGDDGGGTDSNGTTTTNNATGDQTDGATSSPTSTTMTTMTTMTSSMTTTATATGSTTDDPTTTAGTTGGSGGSVMEEFGHACMEDADCKAVLGADGVCLKDILGVYALPGGYCSKLCMLPDANTAYVPNDATCGDGVYCIGADGYFEGCVIECTDNSQCPRQGYECRIMPQLGKDGDPKFCLMTDDNML